MRVLVAGGAGYIGSHAVYQLIEQNAKVIVVDNLSTGHEKAVHPEAILYKGDIRDQKFLLSVFEKEKIEAVLHFAARSLVGESMMEPLQYFHNNVYGTQVLLEVMKQYHIQKIVFSSTAATYGEPIFFPITEEHPTVPTNPYGESKLTIERLLKWSEQAYGIKYFSLRYFNVGGAHASGMIGENHFPETHLIPIILEVASGKRDYLSIFGNDYKTNDGTCIRDYIHVEDLIEAHLLALLHLNKDGESNILNLGNEQGFSVYDILSSARKITKHPIPAQVSKKRPGDPSCLIASSEKAKSILGWKPTRSSINQIIQDAWNWHQKHPHGYM